MDYTYITKLYGQLIRDVEFSHNDSLVAISGEATYIGTLGGNPLFRGNFRNDYEKFYYNLIPEHFKVLTIGESKWAPDDKYLYCIAGGEVYRFSVDRPEFKQFFNLGPDSRFEFKHIALNEKKQVLAAAGQGGEKGKEDYIYVIDFLGKLLFSIPSKHGSQVNSLLFSPDGTKLLSIGNDSFLRAWNADNGALLSEMKLEVNGNIALLGFLNDNTVLVNRDPYPTYTLDSSGNLNLEKSYGSILPKGTNILAIHRSKSLLICDDGRGNASTLKMNNYEGQEQLKVEIHDYIGFVKVAHTHDLLAVALKAQVGPPEVRFFSTDPPSTFLPTEAAGKWVVDASKSAKVRSWFWFVPYEKYPGMWIGVGTYNIYIYDADGNIKHDFKYEQYQFLRACFHMKTQKAVFYRGDKQLFVIDFNKLDLQGTIPSRPQEVARVKTGGDLLDLQWNNAGDKLAGIDPYKRELVIWGSPNFAEIYRSPTIPSIHHLAWSPDDSIIALAADKTTFHYFDVVKKEIAKSLTALGISHINDLVWHNARNELILTGDQFINVFNPDGNPLRKIDFRAESQEPLQMSKPACSPTTSEISVAVDITREGEFHYILDLNKPFRDCITARLRHHMKGISFIQWDQPDRILTMGKSDGLAFWKRA